jgi:Lectin C-type domain/Arylsulfotransferase (ASST)/Putative metal-binding motif
MRTLVPLSLALAACNPEPSANPTSTTRDSETAPEPTGTTTDPTEPWTSTTVATPDVCEGTPPVVQTLFTTRRPALVNAVDLHVTLDIPATVAVSCTRADDPDEVLFYTADEGTEHDIPLRGLAGGTTYDCKFIATCPATAAPETFTVVTSALPANLPEVEVSWPSGSGTTAPPFVLMGHDRHCAGDTARLLMFDQDGEIRWYYEAVPDVDIAYESQYLGDGVFTWGGGYYDSSPPQIFDVDHNVTYTTASPVAQSHYFHHDGRILDSGEMLLMMIEYNSNDVQSWDGFSIALVDPATDTDTYFYSSQKAADDGDLPGGWGDPWHANWADYQHDPVNGDRLYVSLCNLGDVIAIDAATQDVVWKLGDGGDLSVVYPDGTPVPNSKAYPQCQHGLEFVPFKGGGGGNLLVYDNGVTRGLSRLVEYEIDESTMVATQLWGWTEPVWMEPSWGDIDYLPGGHVLGTMGHACWSPNGDDVSSVVELDPVAGELAWRLDFLDPIDAIYRSERVDACDVFPISKYCGGLDLALDALAPLFDPCGPGGTDVDQDGDGFSLCADADCDDQDATSFPGGVEACDGADNDCDGTLDDGFAGTTWYQDTDADGVGGDTSVTACGQPAGHVATSGDCDDTNPDAFPAAPELCDDVDNDCNDAVDEVVACWGCTASNDLLNCTERVSWFTAQDACVSLGGDLVSIADSAENDTVANLAVGEAWIGFNDQSVEGTFAWSNGDPVTFSSWANYEPNDWGGNEDCTGTNFAGTGLWNDYSCTTTLPFVCEL